MKIEIENYRGWSIEFDTEKDLFYCNSESNDKDEYRKSFSSTKKWIDEFIKDNEIFKPVWIESKPGSYWAKKVKLIGIRKDGRFVYENLKGEKLQLSEVNEKDYILYDEANEKYKAEAADIEQEIEQLRKEKIEVLKKITGVELVDYKKQLLGKS